jgi:UDP-N-acetylmuramoylalanine--D-glutamate ligase
LKIDVGAPAGMKVTVMGLGINGGGLASARFFASRGAAVTVTDLRTAETLAESMEGLREFPVRYVLERHEEADFTGADLVIKNPAVTAASPYLAAARSHGVPVETDLSVFLTLTRNPIIAVTGSKGKSTTASAIAFGLSRAWPGARLGGNITVSPLTFLEELSPDAPVVLELSSWQLGDLRGRGLLRPAVSAFTVILPDHLDRYAGMADYVADKMAIFEEQRPGQKAVFNHDDPWQREFPSQTAAEPFFFSRGALPEGCRGAWAEGGKGYLRLGTGEPPGMLIDSLLIPGSHNLMNLLCAGLALRLFGVDGQTVKASLAEFPGVEHRLEMFRTWKGIRFYNDSAATIPHATVSALRALEPPIVLVTGGTDKNIDFAPLAETARVPLVTIVLKGTGTTKMLSVLEGQGVTWRGPYASLQEAVEEAMACAVAATGGDAPVSLLFSPGCTSFGMFQNEFDRGRKFKQIVREITPDPVP